MKILYLSYSFLQIGFQFGGRLGWGSNSFTKSLQLLYDNQTPAQENLPMTKILVIDDEPTIVNLVQAYLKPEGYEVFTATDGPLGLKAVRAFKPDLVVLDVMLPGMDGLELLSRLRRESQVYVILLTARTEETDKIVGFSVGADDYVTKSFSPRELVARDKAALRRMQTGSAHRVGHQRIQLPTCPG
jgi:DNA-binding response OmpR family regulator